MPVEQVQYGLYRYTDEAGNFWSVRCDVDWGNNADSGLLAHVDSDPPFQYVSKRLHPRYVILQDITTGRQTRRICGTNSCVAWSGLNAPTGTGVTATRYETTIAIPGTAITVPYRRVKRYPENMPSTQRGGHPFPEHA